MVQETQMETSSLRTLKIVPRNHIEFGFCFGVWKYIIVARNSKICTNFQVFLGVALGLAVVLTGTTIGM